MVLNLSNLFDTEYITHVSFILPPTNVDQSMVENSPHSRGTQSRTKHIKLIQLKQKVKTVYSSYKTQPQPQPQPHPKIPPEKHHLRSSSGQISLMASASFSTYFPNPYKPTKDFKSLTIPISQNPLKLTQTRKQFSGAVKASGKTTGNEQELIPVNSNDNTDHQVGNLVTENEVGGENEVQLINGFGANEGRLSFEGGFGGGPVVVGEGEDIDNYKLMDRVINASIVLAAGTFGITKLLTIDYDYWHGWTIFEILRYAPQHNWSAYEDALKENPLLAKMMISGVVYSIGDWIAQCCEGKPLLEFDRTRMFRSGLVGFSLHGSLSHYYYYFCEALFPFQDWWAVPVKVAFDQTAWAAVWNSIYFVVVGLLRFESPVTIFSELKATFWPMLTAGWKLWPFAHIITYGVVPIEQRLLWVDCVELIWVTILSTLSNEKSEARILDAPADPNAISSSESSEE